MRNVLLSTVAIVALTGSALAADLPSRKAAPAYIAPVSAFSWTGFYVGIEGGAGFINNKLTQGGVSASTSPTAGLLGGVVGYNYEFPNKFVLGLEGNAGGVLGAKTTNSGAGVYTDHSYYADIRGRVGYAVVDRALLYVAGGVAFGDVKTGFTSANGGGSFTSDRVGYTIGAGLDYAFTNNLIGRVEYRYTDLGRATWGSQGIRTASDSSAVLVGLLYKFGAPEFAPVVAKY
jgi:outer membrane immunogenic protein